jgi:hypothetical protein
MNAPLTFSSATTQSRTLLGTRRETEKENNLSGWEPLKLLVQTLKGVWDSSSSKHPAMVLGIELGASHLLGKGHAGFIFQIGSCAFAQTMIFLPPPPK